MIHMKRHILFPVVIKKRKKKKKKKKEKRKLTPIYCLFILSSMYFMLISDRSDKEFEIHYLSSLQLHVTDCSDTESDS